MPALSATAGAAQARSSSATLERGRRGNDRCTNPSQITILAIDDEAECSARSRRFWPMPATRAIVPRRPSAAEVDCARSTPDLIISDINLAGHSGVTICEQLKQRRRPADVPVMFLSAGSGARHHSPLALDWAAPTTCASRSTPTRAALELSRQGCCRCQTHLSLCDASRTRIQRTLRSPRH